MTGTYTYRILVEQGGGALPFAPTRYCYVSAAMDTLNSLIRFGYDKDPGVHQRGYARADWSLKALEDSRGCGWQVVDLYGNRSPHMPQAVAMSALLDR